MKLLKRWFGQRLSSKPLKLKERAERKPIPGLVAHYWTGSVSVGKGVGNISSTGLYLLTEDRWYPGTMINLTLQKTDELKESADRSILVQMKVIRSGDDGVGLAFVLPDARRMREQSFVANLADKRALDKFLQSLKDTGKVEG